MHAPGQRDGSLRKGTGSVSWAALAASCLVAVLIGTAAHAQIGRETVGRLFFSPEERNVLEAVRQGVVDTGAIPAVGSDIFIPEVAVPEITFSPRIIRKSGNEFEREVDLVYKGLIRHYNDDGSSNALLLINNSFLDEEGQQLIDEDLGVKFRTDLGTGSQIFAEDRLFKTNTELSRGTVVRGDGRVNRRRATEARRFIVVKRDN